MSKFDERLRDLFKSKNLSTVSGAEQIKISKTQLGKYLSGAYFPSLKNAIKICDFFGCSLDYLIGIDYVKNRFGKFSEANHKAFITRYQKLLIAQKLSPYAIAKKLEFNDNNLNYWIKRKTFPSFDILGKVSKELKTSIEFLIGRTDKEVKI